MPLARLCTVAALAACAFLLAPANDAVGAEESSATQVSTLPATGPAAAPVAVMAPAVAPWAVPTPADQAAAQQRVQQAYPQLAQQAEGPGRQPLTPAQRLALAQQLLEAATAANQVPSDKYALLTAARQQAIAAGATQVALQAVDALSESFHTGGLQLRMETLLELEPYMPSMGRRALLVPPALRTAERSAVAGEPAIADRLIALAQSLSQQVQNADLSAAVDQRARIIRQREQALQQLPAAKAAVEAHPHDAVANLALGRNLCLLQGDWTQGLTYLVHGSDPALAAQAAADQRLSQVAQQRHDAQTAAQEVALAQAWSSLGSGQSALAQEEINRRARTWYQRAQPTAGPLEQTIIEQQLARLDAADAQLGEAANFAFLNDNLSDIQAWTIRRGRWTMSGDGLTSTGDSVIELKSPLPSRCRLSFLMAVIKGMRPRIMLQNDGFYFGNEGSVRALWVYGKGTHPQGHPLPYALDEPIRVSLTLDDGRFILQLNDDTITGQYAAEQDVRLRLRTGDNTSLGTLTVQRLHLQPLAAATN